jgi:hypothetical protein
VSPAAISGFGLVSTEERIQVEMRRKLAPQSGGMTCLSSQFPAPLSIPSGWRGAMPIVKLLILGFVAGFLATLIFHQGLWWVFNQIGVIAPDRPAWPLDPVPPYGVPSVISKAFWGGVWGLALVLLLGQLSGTSYWASWVLVGAVALTAVAFYVVAPLKGEPIPPLWPRFVSGMMLNGAWGFGTALLLRLMARF